MRLSNAFGFLPLLVLAATTACVAETATPEDKNEDDLTSLSARSRTLQFDGYVYVSPTASQSTILSTIQKQTRTMFGPLRTAEIGVNNRELKAVDASTFKKTMVTVVDTKSATGATTQMLKVSYRYTDDAVVPVAMARRSAISLAVMNASYVSQISRITKECTANDDEAKEFADSLWYVFDASLTSCRKAITTEQAAIDTETAKLKDPTTTIAKAEVDRLYVATTVALGPDKSNKKTAYPEYDRLYTGGVEPGKLVVGLVNGFLDHDNTAGEIEDSAYPEWLQELREMIRDGSGYTVTQSEPKEDLSTFTANGKTVKGVKIEDIIAWELDGKLPTGFTASDRSALKTAVGAKIIRHWTTLESPVKVKIGSGATKDFKVKINAYFGAETDPTPHKRAIKTSDVFVYNGHSYIGNGPLDPANFSPSDFPSSYQLLFIDGCVSYNYYEKDYFALKSGGTKNLELITNGLEAPVWHSGYALGRFLNTLLNGKHASYKALLGAAADTDSLRVVDGEVDNAFTPSKVTLKVTW